MQNDSGPGTIVEREYIEYMDQEAGLIDGVRTIQLSEDHRLFLKGEFGKFKIYFLVNHTRFEIIPDSVKKISDRQFSATIKVELNEGEITNHNVEFNTPILPFNQVRAYTYGLTPDSFEFNVPGHKNECFFCDLSFLREFGINPPIIPLKVVYIGIAKAEKREAHDRLGEGHKKLQKILAQQNRRQSRQTTSIVLYRPTELDLPIISFPDLIEIIEGTMIQYFKPTPLNIQRLNFPADSPKYNKMFKYFGFKKVITLIRSPRGTQLFSENVQPETDHFTEVIIY